MKKYLILALGLILSLISLNSCKEDIEMVGEFKETAIIYGLLDQSESVHFIKINRAFIGPGNALEIAQIPDSSYFSSVDATVTEFLDNKPTGRSWTLEDTIVSNKNTDGVFYAPTEKVYFFSDASQGKLNDNASYKLNVVLYKGTSKEFEVNGETKLVKGIVSAQAADGSSFEFVSSTNQLQPGSINISNTGNAAIINASLVMNIHEYQDNTLLDSVMVNWNTGEAEVSPNTTFGTSINGERFYELIKENVTSNANINKRQLKSITIKITGGSEEFNSYINANKPSSSLAQTKPNFTNLKVTGNNNVVGIFSSRQTLIIEKMFTKQNTSCLSSKSRRELCSGTITGSLLFCSNNNSDALQTYYCP